MITSLELARRYCRASASDDALLTVLVEAAEGLAEKFLNRKVFADQAALDAALASGEAGNLPMLANAQFRAAVLEIASDRYDNRGDQPTAAAMTRAERILWPDRVGLGV
ncbi:hypothetical protein HNP33_002072 [Comamonas odontotermitis]|uniref:Phage gp6-like head-tail connector protein n=1 Tax=Comamonas odontotermitis TaxID=379895 RepID=A0ABR6RG48_9BURK|nr:head-tail connector protein [Comamonas odontotermitis]MBB6578004.1 hypothetical protein [Comamonas odontotermitis]